MEADEKKCPQCAETVKAEARICRFCGHSFESAPLSVGNGSPAAGKGGSVIGKGCLIMLGIFVLLAVIGSLAGPADVPTSPADTLASGDMRADSGEKSDGLELVGLTAPQTNAARNARQYVEMTGFSRQGLIDQLSSDAGNGYDVADATAAVDSLSVDWNQQAVRSAKQYLQMTGFSCAGLIEQLSSDAGSHYTESQARFGAEQAGAC